MANCCKTNTCVEITPSACVKYTGIPTVGGLIDKQDYCEPSLNELISLFDDTLTSLDTRVGLNKMTFDNVNQACGITPVINTSGLTVKNDKYYSSEIVLQLVQVICELRSRLNYLTAADINTNDGTLHWQDLEIKGSLKTYLADSCFTTNICGTDGIITLGDLLTAMVSKICCIMDKTGVSCE